MSRDTNNLMPMSPLADPVFGGMFANAKVAGLAMQSLICAVLEADNEKLAGRVLSVTPQKAHTSARRRSCRVDIESDTDANELIITEVQIDADPRLMVRNLFSSSHVFRETPKKGDTPTQMASRMPRVIHINLLAHSIRKNSVNLLEPFKILYTKPPHETAIPNFSGYNVQLPQIEKMKPDFENALYCWCYAMYTAHAQGKTMQEVIDVSSEMRRFMARDRGFRQFCTRYKRVAADPKTQQAYVNWVKSLMREEGMKEAAWLRGVEEGERKGIEAVARNLLRRNLSVEDVAEATTLTPTEVVELKKKMQAPIGHGLT